VRCDFIGFGADRVMRLSPPDGTRRHEPILRRLERAADELNPFLIVIVIGLSLLDFSVFTALWVAQLPLR
jgi:hypothetical protein